MVDCNIRTHSNRNNNDDSNDDSQANPLLLPRTTCTLDAQVKVLVRLDQVLLDLLALLLDIFYQGFLLHDYHVEILEELSEFYDGLLDALNFVVAVTDSVKCGLRLAAAVGIEELIEALVTDIGKISVMIDLLLAGRLAR
jgi:hypothetical protein